MVLIETKTVLSIFSYFFCRSHLEFYDDEIIRVLKIEKMFPLKKQPFSFIEVRPLIEFSSLSESPDIRVTF